MKISTKHGKLLPVDTNRLYSTDQANVWAEEFAKRHPEIDEGEMISWFANCAETAKDLLKRQQLLPVKKIDVQYNPECITQDFFFSVTAG